MVEDWHSRMAAKEAAAMRLHVPGAMFAKCIGDVPVPNSPVMPPSVQAWESFVNGSPEDPKMPISPYDAASEML